MCLGVGLTMGHMSIDSVDSKSNMEKYCVVVVFVQCHVVVVDVGEHIFHSMNILGIAK